MAKSSKAKSKLLPFILTAVVAGSIGAALGYTWQQRQDQTSLSPQSAEDQKIIEAAISFCSNLDNQSCNWANTSMGRQKGSNASVKSGSIQILVSKGPSGAWSGVLASQEDDICKTGTDSPQLLEFCQP